jgi:acetolactate synthase-1/3 small subunit
MASSTHTISLFVENVPGVLVRVAGLFVRRGFNVESIAAGPTEHPEYTRITIVVRLEDKSVEQVLKQARKLLPVLDARELHKHDRVDRELMLIRAALPPGGVEAVQEIAQRFQAHVLDVSDTSFLLERTAGPEELDRLIEVLQKFGIQEMARSGRVALQRTHARSPVQALGLT